VVASRVAGPTISDPRFTGSVGANHHKILLCVDPTGAAAPGGGTYSFAIVADNSLIAPVGHTAFGQRLELPSITDPDLSPNNITQNTKGPYIPGDKITASASIAAGDPCVDVFVRMNTCPGSNPSANPPVLGNCGADPLDNAGNRLWTCNAGSGCSGIINPSGAVKITGTIPAGYSYTITCVNEDTNLPQSCVNGGWASANVFHGASFTFKFTAPPTLPCPAGSFTTSIANAAHVAGWPDGAVGDLLVKYDQFPAPNDNSYGDNSIGWKPNRPHRYKDLVNSDHAGILIKNASNQVKLSFNMDYLTEFAGAPSGYKSLGVTGGDGGMLTGTSAGIQVTTSLANNLNNINIPGLFNAVTHAQLTGSVDLFEDSPPTDPAHQTYNISDAALAGWDFHDTYYARISMSNPAMTGFNPATWTVAPNATQLHNSPDKLCPATI
jgi:hypothetical protein